MLHHLLIFVAIFPVLQGLFCAPCEAAVGALEGTLSFLVPNSWAVEAIEIMCMHKFDNKKLCHIIGEEIAPLAKRNLLRNYLNSRKWCSWVCKNRFAWYYPHDEVNRILEGGPQYPFDFSKFVERQQVAIAPKDKIRVLHISDVHLDMNYTEGSSVSCDFPICCHAANGFPKYANAQAGPYGNKNCDCPLKLFDSLLGYLQEGEPIDIVVATGDYSAHNEWEKTEATIVANDKRIEEKIKAALKPSLLIQSPGNNDYIPDHQYDSTKDPHLMKVVKVVSGKQNLTFISLNTMVYDDMNLFLFGDQSYAIFQLMLLEQELSTNKNVILMGHEPPTLKGTAPEFQTVFRALLAKYSANIKGQFFGHTHMDMLTINTYPERPEVATGFGFVSPSVSPYQVGVSRTRIYSMSLQPEVGVVDYVQFKNKDINAPKAEWIVEYSFRDKYHLPKEETPITLEQIMRIKESIFQNEQTQKDYLKLTGQPSERTGKIHCQILDDPEESKRCSATSKLQLNTLIDWLRGYWGYDLTLLG